MLQYIKIENLALLTEVTLEFEAGFTAVTGETGAGKSVLLGALSLLSGARTDKTMIRQAADQLQVESSLFFEEFAGIDAVLEDLGLPLCEEGVLVLRRSIHRTKMRVLINGAMATLSQLQVLGSNGLTFMARVNHKSFFRNVVNWRCSMLMPVTWKTWRYIKRFMRSGRKLALLLRQSRRRAIGWG